MKHITSATGEYNVQLPIRTDNQGNAYSIANYKAKKWPNYAILLEMALTEYYTGIHLVVSHSPRENNQWADQLTHRDTTGFSPMLQIHIQHDPYHIFDSLIQLHSK